MKQNNKGKFLAGGLLAMALAASLMLGSIGCSTVVSTRADGTIATNKVPDVQMMVSLAKSAGYLGTSVYLNGLGDGSKVPAHPQARPQFETARLAVRTLLAAGSFSPADLTAALQALPIKELQGDQGTLVVGEAVILWDTYGQQLANLDKAKVFETYIKPVAQGLLDGLDMALGD